LEYEILEEDGKMFLSYYWKINEGKNTEDKNSDFNMPVEAFLNDDKESFELNPTTTIQKLDISDKLSRKDKKKIEDIELIINGRKYLAKTQKK